MTRALCSLCVLLAAGSIPAGAQAGWKPAPAPLLTRWARDVRPQNPRPEYPRPQFVRREWKSLNGLWQFAFDGAAKPAAFPEKILVPFTFESALSGIGRGKEIHERVWYRRTFDVPTGWKGKRVKLNFGACDWESVVWVNGKELGTHRGGYTPFSFDVTNALKPTGPQEVVVGVYDPADPKTTGWQPKGKQLGSEGIWYTRTTGIWQTVWLEPVNGIHIQNLRVTTTRDGWLKASLHLPGATRDRVAVGLKVTGPNGQRAAASRFDFSPGNITVGARVPSPKLWTPEAPNLYHVALTLRDSKTGRILDEATTYTAFRTVGIQNGRLTLNGKPYFYRGVLDQGFWPDGIYTPPTDAAIRADVEATKRLGFNMARKHVKVDDPRWYYWCDKLGLAVWQDMPSSHNLSRDAAQKNFTREWTDVVNTARDYPCVVHLIPFNENWGNPQAFQDQIVTLTRRLDPSRPITDASGWTQRGLTDVIDAHDYSNNLLKQGVARPVKPKVVGEYGGIALPLPGHTWTQGWGYQTARNPDALVRRVRAQTSQLFEAANLSGFVYTQLTDVEQELNGLLTYDRLPKAPLSRLAAVFQGRDRASAADLPSGFLHDWLVLGPLPAGTHLTSGTDSPAAQAVLKTMLALPLAMDEANLNPTDGESQTVGGRELTWKRATAANDALDFLTTFGGQTDNALAYAVAVFDSPAEIKNATLRFGSDDGATVYLNGKHIWTVARVRGVSSDEDEVRGLTLNAGRNVLVVKVAQGIGGWGVAARFEKPDGSPISVSTKANTP